MVEARLPCHAFWNYYVFWAQKIYILIVPAHVVCLHMLLHVYFKKRNYTFETLPLTLSWPFNLVSSNLCPALPRPATRWHMSLMIRGPSRHTSEQCSRSREKKEKERLHPWEMRRCLLDAINTSGWDRQLLPASVIFLAVQTEWVRIKSQAFSDEDIVAFFPLNMYLGIFLFLTFPLWVVLY